MTITRRSMMAVTAAAAVAGPALARAPLPRFEGGPPLTEWLPGTNKMRIARAFTFYDPRGKKWQVPLGWKVDGASIPRILWPIAGSPFDGPYRDASIIHDYYCDVKTRSWKETHRVFYDAMIASGVSASEAGQKYWAVYHFGPTWGEPRSLFQLPLFDLLFGVRPMAVVPPPPSPEVQQQAYNEASAWIAQVEMTPEQIEQLSLPTLAAAPRSQLPLM